MRECIRCSKGATKHGRSKKGIQRYYCKECKKCFQDNYSYLACQPGVTSRIILYMRESCGIRSIVRILGISCVTVIKKIKEIARMVRKPFALIKGKEYEVDEMRTFIGNKQRLYWIVYALRRDTREVVDFKVGKRTNKTLKRVTNTLLLSEAKKIYSDGYALYRNLIPKELHCKSSYQINHIERKNLSIRTHLKRLSRKTICFSRSKEMLEACLKIYFWSNTTKPSQA